jgi:hypothetical protein
MGPAVRTLLQVASDAFLATPVADELDAIGRLGEIGDAIGQLLQQKNGFFCFEAALRFFPSATVDASWGLHQWNSHKLWKAEYHGLADAVFCFAEDIFGGQFCVVDGAIAKFDPETGDLENLAPTLEEWAAQVLAEYETMTGWRLAHKWQTAHGPLPVRHRLMPKKPFVLGGKFVLSNLIAIDSVRLMKSLGNLAHQIHDLPDGSQIEFKIIP